MKAAGMNGLENSGAAGCCPGVRMPGEFEPHQGCLMIWPVRPGSWPFGARAAQEAFARLAGRIAESETVCMLAAPEDAEAASRMLPSGVRVLEIPTDDAWARDVGPTFVMDPEGTVYGIDWAFNAWGGSVDGLYRHWDKDDLAASQILRQLALPRIDAHPFVLEGGSIHSDGEGTVITTEACLLSRGRNPELTKQAIELRLKRYLGAEKVIWLPHGIYGDETNEHVDNVCAFVRPGEVVLAWTEDESDPQYPFCREDFDILDRETDARGRKLTVHRMDLPAHPVCVTEQDLPGYHYEEGEERRTAGERLAASYVNFYIANHHVLVPQFGDTNDEKAIRLLTELFPERTVVPLYARDILLGGGNIHCITQQIPAGLNTDNLWNISGEKK